MCESNFSSCSMETVYISVTNYSLEVTSATDNGSLSFDHNAQRPEKVYWALGLILLPFFTIFGNILVILSVYKEKSLQSVTNYFIVSLAVADLLVAAIVMPFALYYLVNIKWELSELMCDFWIAFDMTCSTASIFNLVAISIDRFIAVTRPIQYAKHKSQTRVSLTIAIVWIVSMVIASPIVLGMNNVPERRPDACLFYNSDLMLYSSLGSFYIPCVLMVFLYYKIFKAIRDRAKMHIGAKKPSSSTDTSHSVLVIENKIETSKLTNQQSRDQDEWRHLRRNMAINQQQQQQQLPQIVETEGLTNYGSGSAADEEEEEDDSDGDMSNVRRCRVIANQQTEEDEIEDDDNNHNHRHFNGDKRAADRNGHQISTIESLHAYIDSGYVGSNVEETQFCVVNPTADSRTSSQPSSPVRAELQVNDLESSLPVNRGKVPSNKTNNNNSIRPPKSINKSPVQRRQPIDEVDKVKKKSRFNLGRKHKNSTKRREKASAKRERKATKTLAIVLGVFLICWVPFFTCNIMDALCLKFQSDCRMTEEAFLFTTWLGYINSCVNPIIYTIFNPEFRKAFKKILSQCCCPRC